MLHQFWATTFSYGPPSPDFSSVNSAFQSEFNHAAQFPTAASVPAPFPDAAPSATEQLAAMLLKDGVRDAISRFLGHPVVATVVQHIIVAVVNDPGSAARVAQSQIQVVTPIFLQLVSEQPALLGLLPNVLELVKALFLGSGSVHHREPPRATVMHPQARGNSRGCGRRKGRADSSCRAGGGKAKAISCPATACRRLHHRFRIRGGACKDGDHGPEAPAT